MLKWLLELTPEGRLASAADKIDLALTELGTQYAFSDHETKMAVGYFVIEALQRLIPAYDFSRNIHVQFFDFVRNKPVEILQESAKQFSEIAAAARTDNAALFIAMGTIGQIFNLMAVNASTKRARTLKGTGALFTAHGRMLNDMIQYVLYNNTPRSTGAP